MLIVIHCSDSPHGRGDDAATIHRWHQERGFDGIGYHYVITENGERQAGRPHYWRGAHVAGKNANSLGICLIGRDQFTEKQFDELHILLTELGNEYPDAWIVGHSDLDNKKRCPGFSVSDWLQSRGFMNSKSGAHRE